MPIPRDIVREYPGLSVWNIMSCYRGSIAHGMWQPNTDPNSIDDKDVMAVCVPDLQDHYFGLRTYGSKGTRTVMRGEWDIVIYEARKMFRLLAKGNPNVLTTLWLEPRHYISKTPAWDLVLENRELFVARHAYHSFTGYAHGQLHRMTHMAFEGYMGEKRKALVKKYGYDTKNAAHLIRILRMGIEFMVEGRLHVTRPDAQQLLEIKHGEWTLAEVKAEAARLFETAELAYVKFSGPHKPDREAIAALSVQVIKMALDARDAS